jgi:hypothetical protein
MWVMYFFLTYLVLALLIPTALALGGAWRRARVPRPVTCPESSSAADVSLDPWYAVRMHAIGDPEPLVRACSRWPDGAACGRQCLVQIGAAV